MQRAGRWRLNPRRTGQGQFTARGIRGDVALSWHGSRDAEKPTDGRLEVVGEVVVTADEMLQEIRADGRFKVRGFGGPIESFQVRLPAGMRLRESQESGYSVRPVQAEGAATATDQVVEVRLDRPDGRRSGDPLAGGDSDDVGRAGRSDDGVEAGGSVGGIRAGAVRVSRRSPSPRSHRIRRPRRLGV